MKVHLFILFLLVLSTSTSCKEEIKFKKQEASLVPLAIKKIQFNKILKSEFIQAKESGILSDYQSTIWAGVNRIPEIKKAAGFIMTETHESSGQGNRLIFNTELVEYQVSEQILNENTAYQSDWELSLWHLAE